MTRLRLPIGIQSFRKIRQNGCYCVDKIPFVGFLLDSGEHYFLSRPRRFGQSVFLSTLKELFEGHESLFKGPDIHPHGDWTAKVPVLRLSFGRGHFSNREVFLRK